MVTVIIATYNREHTLGRAIESVLAQDLHDWDLVIVDDGSEDASAAVVQRYPDPRIRLIRHGTNKGVRAAKNTGFDHIRGDWFTTLDSDDEMVPDALSVMVSTAERTGATAITCNAVDATTGGFTGTGLDTDGWMASGNAALFRGVYWGITRTHLLGDLRLDERIPWGGEESLWTKIDRKARRYYVCRGLLIVHTEGSDRMTVKNKRRSLAAKLRGYRDLGDDEEYLAILRETDPRMYRHHRNRILVAKMFAWTTDLRR